LAETVNNPGGIKRVLRALAASKSGQTFPGEGKKETHFRPPT